MDHIIWQQKDYVCYLLPLTFPSTLVNLIFFDLQSYMISRIWHHIYFVPGKGFLFMRGLISSGNYWRLSWALTLKPIIYYIVHINSNFSLLLQNHLQVLCWSFCCISRCKKWYSFGFPFHQLHPFFNIVLEFSNVAIGSLIFMMHLDTPNYK